MQNDRLKFRVYDKRVNAYVLQSGLYYGFMIDTDGVLKAYRETDFDYGNDPVDTLTDAHDFIIEQCTGLRDKHGNLIYEGDIVLNKNGDEYEVFWAEPELCWALESIKTTDSRALNCFDGDECEIIGNIHKRMGNEKVFLL